MASQVLPPHHKVGAFSPQETWVQARFLAQSVVVILVKGDYLFHFPSFLFQIRISVVVNEVYNRTQQFPVFMLHILPLLILLVPYNIHMLTKDPGQKNRASNTDLLCMTRFHWTRSAIFEKKSNKISWTRTYWPSSKSYSTWRKASSNIRERWPSLTVIPFNLAWPCCRRNILAEILTE